MVTVTKKNYIYSWKLGMTKGFLGSVWGNKLKIWPYRRETKNKKQDNNVGYYLIRI